MANEILQNKIYQGDCLNLFKHVPDESVDVVFADPPFNLKKHYANYSDDKTPEEYLAWSKEWIAEALRVTKPTGAIIIHNVPIWLAHYTELLNKRADFKNWIVWDAPTNCYFHGLRPTHYGILCYAKNKDYFKLHKLRSPHQRHYANGHMSKQYGGSFVSAHPFGPVLSNVWTDINRASRSEQRGSHPCQLPVALVERILLLATEEGELILDPFMGTGTTAVAAMRLGRNFIGFEKSNQYINLAKYNLQTRVYVSKMGDQWVSIHHGKIKTIRAADWDILSTYYQLPDDPKEIETSKLSLKDSSLLSFARP